MKNSMQKGFTLIELMIVIAIIGVLAAVAIPAYQDYIAKSQVTVGLADISGGKIGAEAKLNEGVYVGTGDAAAAAIGLASSSTRCSGIAVSFTSSSDGTIVCTLTGATTINTKTITLTRASDAATGQGGWTCATTVDAKYKPKGCGG